MIEFVKTNCMACEIMAPVIDNLRRHYARSLTVQQVDVLVDAQMGSDYSVIFLPTQVYLDGAGRELYRHVGIATEDGIVANWRQLGYNLHPMPTHEPAGLGSLVFYPPARANSSMAE